MDYTVVKNVISQKAQLGAYLYVEGRGTCKVINREAIRGRRGYVKILLLFGDKTKLTINSTFPSSWVNLRAATKPEVQSFQREYEFPEFGKKEAPPPPTERLRIVYQSSGSLKISPDQMAFFKFANLPQFPCTLSELKKGYALVCHAVHPDKNPPAGTPSFDTMTNVYEKLKTFCTA